MPATQLMQFDSPASYQPIHTESQARQDTQSPTLPSYHPSFHYHSPGLALTAKRSTQEVQSSLFAPEHVAQVSKH